MPYKNVKVAKIPSFIYVIIKYCKVYIVNFLLIIFFKFDFEITQN